MAQDYNNIPAGLRLSTQIPLDVKSYIADEATLAYLGTANNLAYTYVDGMVIYCIAEKTKYVWREVEAGEENTGLVPLDFTYPANSITFGIDYSSKKYNFFPIPGGVAVLNDLNDVTIASLANNNLLAYNSTSSQWENETYASLGLQTTITNPVTGYGTTNKIPKYLNASGGLGNSALTDNGTIINSDLPIDITSPSASYYTPLGGELLTVSQNTGWVLNTGWSGNVTSGFTHASGSGVATLTNSITSSTNVYYQLTLTISSAGSLTGSITAAFAGASLYAASVGTVQIGPKATGASTLVITPTNDFNGTVIVSLKIISTTSPLHRLMNPSGVDVTSRFETRSYTGDLRSLFVGVEAGRRATTGDFNTFLGYTAGANATTANNNTFVGYGAGRDNVIGVHNTFVGNGSGLTSTSSYNTVLGSLAGYGLTNALNNTLVGFNSGSSITSGSGHTFIGHNSGANMITDAYNTFIGTSSGGNLNSGSANVFLGYETGRFIADGTTGLTVANNSVIIGASSKALANSQTNQIVIGYQTVGLGSNSTVIGSTSTNVATIYGKLAVPAGTTARAQFNLAVSVAPTTPVDGDIWLESNTNTGLKIRINGVTKTVTLA
jgi:hypothetical protein